jgi:hypothetical protein
MRAETYWTIEVTQDSSKGRPFPGTRHLEYYPDNGGVAEVLFTDEARARAYAEEVIDGSEGFEGVKWQTTWIDGQDLDHFVGTSLKQKTHVLIDPERGKEEQMLEPIIWQ